MLSFSGRKLPLMTRHLYIEFLFVVKERTMYIRCISYWNPKRIFPEENRRLVPLLHILADLIMPKVSFVPSFGLVYKAKKFVQLYTLRKCLNMNINFFIWIYIFNMNKMHIKHEFSRYVVEYQSKNYYQDKKLHVRDTAKYSKNEIVDARVRCVFKRTILLVTHSFVIWMRSYRGKTFLLL